MEEYATYLNDILSLEEKDKICGEIYKITNIETNKVYIGQTMSHHKNHNKYRPFGYIGRYGEHLSVARNLTKQQSVCYLYNSMRVHGEDKFKIELLLRCHIDETDHWEIEKIKEYNSIFPNGYNLTEGGKSARYKAPSTNSGETLNEPKKRGGCTERSEKTRQLMSERQKAHLSSKEVLLEKSAQTKQQHLEKKFDKLKHVKDIDSTNIDKYIHVIHENKSNRDYVRVIIDKVRIEFNAKHETLEEIKNRARSFILDLIKRNATLPNCSGNP